MYKVLATLMAVAVFVPSVAFAASKAIPCQYQDRAGVHTGKLTPAGGDGSLCVDRKGKAHELYAKPVKEAKPALRAKFVRPLIDV